jgi:hypothetical protein
MGTTVAPNRPLRFPARATDTYGMVLLLILLDYLVIATLSENDWGKVCIVFLQGITIWFALSVSRSHRIWQVLAIAYLVLSVLAAIITALAPGAGDLGRRLTILGGLLLLVTPFVISRRIASHMVVSTETVMGAISVYLLIGMSFAYIYLTIDTLIPAPFFVGLETANINNYLFFSYTTLTTVGYGNLIPAGTVGQTFAMLEALIGQIYLVIVVARLASLWGQRRPERAPLRTGSPGAAPGDDQGTGDDLSSHD